MPNTATRQLLKYCKAVLPNKSSVLPNWSFIFISPCFAHIFIPGSDKLELNFTFVYDMCSNLFLFFDKRFCGSTVTCQEKYYKYIFRACKSYTYQYLFTYNKCIYSHKHSVNMCRCCGVCSRSDSYCFVKCFFLTFLYPQEFVRQSLHYE